MLISQTSLANVPSELFDPELLKLSLKSVPTNRTNFYFETKSLQGFKPNLQEEISDLLVELQCCEEHLQKIISIFGLFIDHHQNTMEEKEEKIYGLSEELEKVMVKDYFKQNHEPLLQQNIALLEKIATLNSEIELLDKECLRYEKMIEELRDAASKNKNGENADFKSFFLKNYTLIKLTFPDYFCLCLGKFDETLRELSIRKSEIVDLKKEIEELKRFNTSQNEEMRALKEKLDLEYREKKKAHTENQDIIKANQALQQELKELLMKREVSNDDLVNMNGKLESIMEFDQLGTKRTSFELTVRRTPKSSQSKEFEISALRSAIRKRTNTNTKIYSNLLNEIERSLKSGENLPNEFLFDAIDKISRLKFSIEASEKEFILEKSHRCSNDIKEPLVERSDSQKATKGCLERAFDFFRLC